jgi:predicted ArsR family transcriptional regulator
MRDQIKHISDDGDPRVERTIVVSLLEEAHRDGCTRTQLARELGLAGAAFETPLARLREEGVVELVSETVRASRATVHLDTLELIAI